MKSFAFKDARLRKLGADVAVLTHIATQDVTCGTQKLPPTVASTSIYVKQKGMWMSAFYQETPLE